MGETGEATTQKMEELKLQAREDDKEAKRKAEETKEAAKRRAEEARDATAERCTSSNLISHYY